MLEVKNLTVRYGRVEALRDVSLQVGDGELVTVVGPNGAGKSTLVNAIAGRTRSAAGTICFQGAKLDGLAPERIVRSGISLVPEGRHIFETLSVGENLKLGMMASRGRTGQRELDAMIGAHFPVLQRFLQTPAGLLSGGEQQQLAIARAMAARPDVLLLDEPSLGLAPLMVDEVFGIIEQLHAEGTPMLLIEQNAQRAIGIADRGYVLRSGRIVMEGTRDQILGAADEMTSAYLGG